MALSPGHKLRQSSASILNPLHWKVRRRVTWIWLIIFFAVISLGLVSFQLYSESYKYYNPPVVRFTNNYFLELEDYVELGYIVNTPTCTIVNISAWDKAIQPFILEPTLVNCHAAPRQWTYTHGKDLFINESSVEDSGYSLGTIDCCYMTITRVEQSIEKYDEGADTNIRFSKDCFPLRKPVNRIPVPHEFLRVQCRGKYWPSTRDILYRQFHAIPQHPKNPATEQKVQYWANRKKSRRRRSEAPQGKTVKTPPNVVIVGIDSVSRLSFHRNMPKTKMVLEELGALEMLGYTKVGENTIPNAMSFLSGYSKDDLMESCFFSSETAQDGCPYIWKRFSQANYVTAMVEDAPLIAIFHYMKTGFVKQPVDYFFRPFMLGVHQRTPTPYYTLDCIGSRTVDEVLLQYIREMLDVSTEEGSPLFLLSWLTNLAHADFNAAKAADGIYADFIRGLNLNNTILFFISDHGYRFGEIRQTFPGWYEDKLPNSWVYLPTSIRKEFPSWQSSLEINTKRLSSPFDIFRTMSQVLDTYTSTPQLPLQKSRNGTALPRNFGQSLFTEIPVMRECESSGIADEYCACVIPKKLPSNDTLLRKAAMAAVGRINEFIPSECAQLRLSQVAAGAVKTKPLDLAQSGNGTSPISLTFIVAFSTEPGDFLFEANVNYYARTVSDREGEFKVGSEQLRMNKISTDVSCVRDGHLEKYCYCKSLLSQS